MKTTARRLPAAPTALAAALLTAFLVLIAPLSASAHDSLTASSPEADSTVDTLPAELTLTFSAKLIDGTGATEVVVTDSAGQSVTDGPATVDGAIVTQPLVAEAAAGEYSVIWKVVSSDGHPTSGEFGFAVSTSTISEPTAGPTEAPATTDPGTTPSATAAATPAPTEAAEDGSPAAVWIWVLAIAGVLVLASAIIVAAALRRRGTDPADGPAEGADGGSDAPSAR